MIAARNAIAVTKLVIPVRPPAAIPALDSTTVVTVEVPTSAAPPCPPFPFTVCIPIHFYEIAPCAISGKTKKRIPRSCEILCWFFLSRVAHSRMKLPGFPGSCNYVVNSLRQLVETLDPSPEYTYRHLFYEVVVIIDFGIWKVYGQSFSKSRHIFSTITDFCMSYAIFPYNFNILFQKSQMSFSILFWIFSSI